MYRKFKALLLAAGLGTRLKPYTNHHPKCLVDIGGKPLLEHWLKNLEDSYCEEVLINTHYLFKKVSIFKPPSSRKDSKESFIICKILR